MPPLSAPPVAIKKQIKRPRALLSSDAEKADLVPAPENADQLSSASVSPRLHAPARKRHVYDQTRHRSPDPPFEHEDARFVASSSNMMMAENDRHSHLMVMVILLAALVLIISRK